MNYSRYIRNYIDKYTKRINELTELLTEFTEGELHTKNGTNFYHNMIHRPGRPRVYLRTRKDRSIARELAVKADVKAELEDCEASLAICRALLVSIENYSSSRERLNANPGVRKLLDEAFTLLEQNGTFFTEQEWASMITGRLDERFWDIAHAEYRKIVREQRRRLKNKKGEIVIPEACILFEGNPDQRALRIREQIAPQMHFDEQVQAWLREDYVRCSFNQGELRYPTYFGEKMRSKLEVHAAEILKRLGIAYRYEAQLIVGHETYYPDFTMMHPRTHRLVYMEIFGLMSDQNYAVNTGLKLKNYTLNGYVIGKNLLCYTETDDDPLDFELMETELEHLLLS